MFLRPSTAWTSVLSVALAADAIPAGCDGALFRLLAFGDVDGDTSQQHRRSLVIDDRSKSSWVRRSSSTTLLRSVMSLPIVRMQGFRLSVIKSAEMRNCRNSPL